MSSSVNMGTIFCCLDFFKSDGMFLYKIIMTIIILVMVPELRVVTLGGCCSAEVPVKENTA